MSNYAKPLPPIPRKRATKVVRRRAPVRRTRPRVVVKKTRRGTTIHGYGDYIVNPEHSRGQQLGGELGSFVGEKLGGLAHNLLGGLISGLGDYQVKQNVLLAPELPVMINDSVKGGIVIRHQEYLGDVFTGPLSGASTAFTINSFLINPANSKTFPFLSQIAQNYELYSLEGVVFSYRSMSADALNSTNTALGSVIMCTQYDVLDPIFRDKSEMENYEWGNSCRPSVNMLHPIECAPRQNALSELYTLSSSVLTQPSNADPRMYHWGRMSIATVGFQAANVNIGELHVTFQCRLIKPKLFATLGQEIGTYSYFNPSFTNLLPLGSGTAVIERDNIGIFVDAPNRNIGFPIKGSRAHYLVQIEWEGAATAITHPTRTLTNCTQTSYTSWVVPNNGATVTSMSQEFTIMVEANNAGVVTYGVAGTLPTASTTMRIKIETINPAGF